MHSSFCPHDESRILTQMFNITGNGIQYVYNKKLFDTLSNRILVENRDWFILTLNGYYDLAIYNWSMLFGAYSEPTHYKKLLEHKNISECLCRILGADHIDKENLQCYLLECIGLSDEEYKKVHQEIWDYRDRFLAHREHSPSKISSGDLIFPELKLIKKTLEAFYLLLVKIVHSFPDNPDENNKYHVSYLLLYSYEDIEEFVRLTFPSFDALLKDID